MMKPKDLKLLGIITVGAAYVCGGLGLLMLLGSVVPIVAVPVGGRLIGGLMGLGTVGLFVLGVVLYFAGRQMLIKARFKNTGLLIIDGKIFKRRK